MKSGQASDSDLLDLKLAEIGRQGLGNANASLLQDIAKLIWYSEAVPRLSRMPDSCRCDTGYLVDKLARFNIVNKERKLALIAAITPFIPETQNMPSSCRDTLAQKWGASTDLTERMRELLPLQTRHYANAIKSLR